MKVSLTGMLIVILSVVISISAIHTNRLKSDSNHFKENIEYLYNYEDKDAMLDEAKQDFYRDDYGYYSPEGKFYKENHREEYLFGLSISDLISIPDIRSTVYISTDVGDYFIGNLPQSEWIYDDRMVEWDWEYNEVEDVWEDSGIELDIDGDYRYFIKDFSISEGDTYWLEDIYNIDFNILEEVTRSPYHPNLNGKPKIILKVKDNAIISYSILNQKIYDYNRLLAYDLNGNKIMEINKNYNEKIIETPSTDGMRFVLTRGTLIEFSFDNMEYLNLDIDNPFLTQIERDGFLDEFYNFEGHDYIKTNLNMNNYDNVRIIFYESKEIETPILYIAIGLQYMSKQ